MPEGRVRNDAGTLVNEYVVTDQQGNARISFQNNGGTAKVIQENSYYAFGLTMPGSPVSTPTNPNKNLYNGGSEVQDDLNGLPDLMQTFYRNYDAALGRWTGVDPQSESAESMTAYQYAGNNPVMMNDPMGDLFDSFPADLQSADVLHLHGIDRLRYLQEYGDPYGDGSSGGGGGSSSGGVASPGDVSLHITDQRAIGNIWGLLNGNNETFSINPFSGLWDTKVSNSYTDASGNVLIGGVYEDWGIARFDHGAKDQTMNLSQQGLRFIANNESFGKNGINPYNDPLGYATAGYGHLLHKSAYTESDFSKYHGMSKADGLVLLRQDVASRVATVNKLVTVPLTQYQFDSLVDFTFNVGEGAFGKSTLLREINAKNFGEVPNQFSRWTNGGLPGLINRINVEINLFVNGSY